MNRVERKEYKSALAQAILKKGLTSEGRDWFTLALDPFHDYQHPVAGYPDADSSHTVVSCFQYALDVSKPAGAAGNWDAHVFSMPFVDGCTLGQFGCTVANKTYAQNAGIQVPLGPISVFAADAGQPLWPTTSVWAPTNFAYQTIDMTAQAGAGLSRVIGFGFEIVNTTAEIYKQGALTAYRMPQEPKMDVNIYYDVAGTTVGQSYVYQYRALPSKSADAMLLGGTKQWAAADGAYVAVPLASVHNPLGTHVSIGQHYSQKADDAALDNVVASNAAFLSAVNVAPVMSAFNSVEQKYIPYCSTGVFMTGLSPQSTFRVKVKVYVERAPTFAEPELAVLATPSAPYDAKVLQLYSACLSRLPVAVPVSMNAAGDWWKMVLNTVAAVAVPVGTILGGPAGAAIGGAVAAGASAASLAIPDSNKNSNRSSRPPSTPPPKPLPQVPKAPDNKNNNRSKPKK